MPTTPFTHATSQKTDSHKSYSELIMDSKDRRTFHSERQRVLHAGDRRKAKAGRGFKPQRDPREHIDETTCDFSAGHIDDEEQDDPILPELTGYSGVGVAGCRTAEVPLTDIIKPGRKRKGVAADFEIVSRPGEVLALPMNEGFEDEDEDLYVGWEDVSGGLLPRPIVDHGPGKSATTNTRPTSYAAVLSTHR